MKTKTNTQKYCQYPTLLIIHFRRIQAEKNKNLTFLRNNKNAPKRIIKYLSGSKIKFTVIKLTKKSAYLYEFN